LLKLSWSGRGCTLEVAKPEVDSQGYDLIAEECGVVRHIQLKAAYSEANTIKQKVHIALQSKPSGCVIWVLFNETTLDLGPFLFFGGKAGEPLPDITNYKVAKHTKANAQGVKLYRPEIREIPKGKFRRLESVKEVYEMLFKRA
jgi:hypothetical protein